MVIKEINYSVICDTYRCNRHARYSIGNEGEPTSTHHVVCEKCLKAIADALPIELIKDRLKKPCKQCHMSQIKVEAQEQLDKFSLRELKDLAKKEGIKGYSSMNKDQLIGELTRGIK